MYLFHLACAKYGVILIGKKKEVEQKDAHIKEAYLAEGKEEYTAPIPPVLSTTPIPNSLIAPIPIPTPRLIEQSSPVEEELLAIDGVDEKIKSQLEKLGINNIDDLAKASAEKLARKLKVDLATVKRWISTAKNLH